MERKAHRLLSQCGVRVVPYSKLASHLHQEDRVKYHERFR